MQNHAQLGPPRDSLELASLASSTHDNGRASQDSSASGAPSSRHFSSGTATPVGVEQHNRRSYSVSSAFDFNAALFPLSSSGAGYTALGTPSTPNFDPLGQPNLERNKSLSYLNGLSLVIGVIIGGGIFSSPASVNSNTGSPGAALIVWTISGVLAWTGAASYAELGGAIPLNGGAQVYLAKIFGEWAGFLFTWCSVVVLKPGGAAIISIILGEYLVQAVIGAEAAEVSPWVHKSVGIAAVFLVTLLNSVSTKLGTRSTDIFMFFKVAALIAITVTGIVVGVTGTAYNKAGLSTDWRNKSWFDGTSTSTSQWAVAFYAGLWAYDGWDNTNFVVGELVHPGRNLPLVIHTALPLVIVSYLLANVAYTFVLPADIIASSNTVAVAFGSTVFGPIGSLVLALAVAGSCFGSMNAGTFTTGRLIYSASKEGYIPAIFATIGFSRSSQRMRLPRRGSRESQLTRWFADEQGFFYTPIYAMLLNTVLTTGFIVVGDFTTLTTFYGVASYLFYFAAVVGLLLLRVKEPELERPYKCWISTPIIFCCVSLFLLSRAIFAKPFQALAVLAFLAIGFPLYWLQVRRLASRSGKGGDSDAGWEFWKRWGRG